MNIFVNEYFCELIFSLKIDVYNFCDKKKITIVICDKYRQRGGGSISANYIFTLSSDLQKSLKYNSK